MCICVDVYVFRNHMVILCECTMSVECFVGFKLIHRQMMFSDI